ncbi:hypothetical protein [Microbulbifer sp. THAF38]|uniref:hypothetical protein n=1 Tax=Microbulbifer sp. THAF38 TaxID=2587856 RepID=UPI0012698715|nr:hypothetical protein [Microbulbifer sp. THAF38]QFT53285.1 hypothetical protein FIU95_01650 [Microbulbifer sp. THAF38]
MKPEVILLIVNTVIICAAYLYIYPRHAGANLNKVIINDLFATGIALLIAGILFGDAELKFNMLLFTANWFGFSLISFLLIELPFFKWYWDKYSVNLR